MKWDAVITDVCREITERFQPEAIYIFQNKRDLAGRTTSFKLCVVVRQDAARCEHDIYLQVECPVPFDVLCYTSEDFAEKSAQSHTFASRIAQTGEVFHG